MQIQKSKVLSFHLASQLLPKDLDPMTTMGPLFLSCKQVFWPPDAKRRLIRKDPLERLVRKDPGKDWMQEEKRMTEDEMVGWHHWLNGQEFEQAPQYGEGQGNLAYYSSWGCRVRHGWATDQQRTSTIMAVPFIYPTGLGYLMMVWKI